MAPHRWSLHGRRGDLRLAAFHVGAAGRRAGRPDWIRALWAWVTVAADPLPAAPEKNEAPLGDDENVLSLTCASANVCALRPRGSSSGGSRLFGGFGLRGFSTKAALASMASRRANAKVRG